jgi:hypothetical protein
VQLEVGTKRVFATALDWPGWSRTGGSTGNALDALIRYGPRYKAAIAASKVAFTVPNNASALTVIETSGGTTSTDFGVPSLPALVDEEPLTPSDLRRLTGILRACWRA